MSRALAAVVSLGLVCACRNEAPPASRTAPAPAAAPPSGQQCLPALTCGVWTGCALVATARVANGCTDGSSCPAAITEGANCGPRGIPPIIIPPTYTCSWNGTACVRN